MASSKFRRALGAVKDQTSIGLAKVGSSNSLADLDVAIVKATRHEEYPTEEKYIREILSLTCYSRAYISACVNTISRRLNKTKNWIVALKTLMLIQRLLSEGDPAYEQEIFFSTRRGTRFLNMSDFRDASTSNSWDYSAFVRTYALYLDERLEFRMQSRRGKRSAFGIDDEDDPDQPAGYNNNQAICPRATPVQEMRHDKLFSRMQHLQQLLERFLACRPTGIAKNNRVVVVALYPLVKESFQVYYDITEIMGILIDRFMELEVPDGVKVYDIFVRIGKQFDELDVFYNWCKTIGIARSSEYPEVEKITPKKLEVMDEYIRDKSALAQGKRVIRALEPKSEPSTPVEEEEPADMNSMKALPPPEEHEPPADEEEKQEEPVQEEPKKQTEGDLLSLGEDVESTQQHGDQLALALFNVPESSNTATSTTQPWEAFTEEADWETALVQSASHLSNQKNSLGGGFDPLLLDGMYQKAEVTAAMAGPGYGNSGSASSVALGSAGRPAMLALPAPPTTSSDQNNNNSNRALVVGTPGGHVDPFSASLVVPPPSYVQMSDLEKKQKLLMEEQMMWHQYARDGMQGQLGLTKLQHNPHHNMGGYTHTY